MKIRPAFQLVFIEGAPLSTLIRCHSCGGLRGTLGDLLNLAEPGQLDIFVVE
jgi:hypothetical protein